MKNKLLPFIIIAASCIGGCEKSTKNKIVIAIGETFHISRNPELGREQFEYDTQFLEPIREVVVPPDQSVPFTDSDGRVWYYGAIIPNLYTFKALKAGRTSLKILSTNPATVYAITILPQSNERLDGRIYH